MNTFGESTNADLNLNRARLAERIFAHHEREKLNAIVHPEVRSHAAELVEAAVNSQLFGHIIDDIPLLVETLCCSSTASLRYRRSPYLSRAT